MIATGDPTLHLPRILCLHGGGTNARIFRAQCRALRVHLAPFFRLVFADAPFFSRPGPDVESVYAEWGPFRSWFPTGPGGAPFTATAVDALDQATVAGIDQCIAAALCKDDAAGAKGTCVGLLGFSQGAKMAASLLWRRQQHDRELYRLKGWLDEADRDGSTQNHAPTAHGSWKSDSSFAVLLAGRPPLVSMNPDMKPPCVLHLPTIHVHGLRDAGIIMHRELLNQCCEKGSVSLVEWDGDHRIPIKSKDVGAVVAEILRVASETGVLSS